MSKRAGEKQLFLRVIDEGAHTSSVIPVSIAQILQPAINLAERHRNDTWEGTRRQFLLARPEDL